MSRVFNGENPCLNFAFSLTKASLPIPYFGIQAVDTWYYPLTNIAGDKNDWFWAVFVILPSGGWANRVTLDDGPLNRYLKGLNANWIYFADKKSVRCTES